MLRVPPDSPSGRNCFSEVRYYFAISSQDAEIRGAQSKSNLPNLHYLGQTSLTLLFKAYENDRIIMEDFL